MAGKTKKMETKGKTILKELKKNQELITTLDVDYFLDKIQEKEYKEKRTKLRANVNKIVRDNPLIDKLKVVA